MPTTRRRFFGQLAGGAATLWALGCKREGETTTPPTDAAAAAKPAPTPAAPEVPRVEDFPEKTLLVLGGTGFLGPHVVDAALAQGWKVTLFNRGKTNADLFPELEKLHGDRDGKLDALEGRRFRAVIDTSGYVPRIVRMSAELLAPNVAHYMFVSSISAYADFTKIGITEDYPVAKLEDPNTEEVMAAYGGLKAACEAAVEATLPGRTINVRPGYIVGPRDPTDRFTYWPVRVDEGGEMLAPGTPQDPVQVIDVRDLAAWMIGALEASHMGIYNLCGPVLPLGDMLAACQEHATKKPTLTWVDKEFLAAQKVEPGQIPIWVPPGEPGFEGFAQVSAQKAIDTGLTTRPISETVRDTLAWWRELPEERRSKLRAGLPAEREKELLAAWYEQHPEAKPAKPSKPAKPAKGKKKVSFLGAEPAGPDRFAGLWVPALLGGHA